MILDELLDSYDPIDVEYRHYFADKDEPMPIQRKSFIPSKEELEKIFFVPRKCTETYAGCVEKTDT